MKIDKLYRRDVVTVGVARPWPRPPGVCDR
jgi:hypothetical protein